MLLSHYFTPTINAGTLRWEWLSRELEELGAEITVLGPQSSPFPASQPASERPTPGSGPRVGLARRAWREMAAGLRTVIPAVRLRADVVLVTAPPLPHLFPAWLASRIRSRPLVLDLRDTWPELLVNWRSWGDTGIPDRRRVAVLRARQADRIMGLLAWWIRWLERGADLVITTTDSYAEHLRTLGFRRVITIRNTASARWTVGPSQRVDGELRILYLGTVGRAQHLATAVEAVAQIKDRVPVVLRVVGAGVHYEDLKRLAKQLDAPVEFLPKVSRHDVRAQYEWCDTSLVMLRDWPALQMAVPSKLYEAMTYGRHVTACLNGEPAQIVAETRSGDVVAAGDVSGLAQLWQDLANDRARLAPPSSAADWLAENADQHRLAEMLYAELSAVVADG